MPVHDHFRSRGRVGRRTRPSKTRPGSRGYGVHSVCGDCGLSLRAAARGTCPLPPFCDAPNVRSEAPPNVAWFIRGPRRGHFGAWADLYAGLLPAPVSRQNVRRLHLGGVP